MILISNGAVRYHIQGKDPSGKVRGGRGKKELEGEEKDIWK